MQQPHDADEGEDAAEDGERDQETVAVAADGDVVIQRYAVERGGIVDAVELAEDGGDLPG